MTITEYKWTLCPLMHLSQPKLLSNIQEYFLSTTKSEWEVDKLQTYSYTDLHGFVTKMSPYPL